MAFYLISILAEISLIMIDNRLILIDLKRKLEEQFSDTVKEMYEEMTDFNSAIEQFINQK
jgi:hypothetical protein